MESKRFDIIVIGSGMGALCLASLLTKLEKKRVLVIERHGKLGGFTHVFKRLGRFHFDTGLHYVGDVHPNSPSRRLFSFLTGARLEWNQMPHFFERFLYPGLNFAVPSDPSEFQEHLCSKFPSESQGINHYFRDLKKASRLQALAIFASTAPLWLQKIIRWRLRLPNSLSTLTTKEYFDQTFDSPELKALLASQWMDYGLPPGKSSFVSHAMIASHYLNGAFYPKGGAGKIAESIRTEIEPLGCTFVTATAVQEILVENNVACGVRAQNGEVYRADAIVSNAGARNTFLKLLPQYVPISFRKSLEQAPPGFTQLSLFVGFKKNPECLGVQGENFWIFSGFDHDQMEKDKDKIVEGKITSCYLSFPSLKDGTRPDHTAEILVPVSYELFKPWRDQPVKNRDQTYLDLKGHLIKVILNFVDGHLPGFRDLVEFAELGTPLTNEHYENSYHGEIYGIPVNTERVTAPWIGPKTPIKNLYLVGADAASHGIVGALWSGFLCYSQIAGPFRAFRDMGRLVMKEV